MPKRVAALAVTAAPSASGVDAAQLGHEGGRERHVGGLVALSAVRRGGQVRTVRLHHEAVFGNEAGDLGKRPRVLVGDGAGQRDEEAEVEAAPGDLHVAGEAVHDAADLPRPLLGEDGERFIVGVTAVDDQGLAQLPGHGDLATEDLALRLGRREVAEEVEAHLAESDHLRFRAGQLLHLGEVGLHRVPRVVGMNAHGGPHIGKAPGQLHHCLIGLPIRSDGHHAAHSGPVRPLQHSVEIVRVVGEMQVGVGVEEPHQRLMIAQGVTVKRRRPMSWPEAVITSTW